MFRIPSGRRRNADASGICWITSLDIIALDKSWLGFKYGYHDAGGGGGGAGSTYLRSRQLRELHGGEFK
jgi:hypothetical protein